MKFLTPALLVATLIVLQQVESKALTPCESSENSKECSLQVNRNLKVPINTEAEDELNLNSIAGLFDSFKKFVDTASTKLSKLDSATISQAVDKVSGLVDTVLDLGKKEDKEKPKEEPKKEEKKEEPKKDDKPAEAPAPAAPKPEEKKS